MNRPALRAMLMLAALTGGPALAQPDAGRGAAIVANRTLSLCVLCHAVPGQPAPLQGTIGPPLAGVGARLDADTLRQRLLAPERFNPDTVMPAYSRTAGLQLVAPTYRDQPLLTPGQIDDVLAYLVGLR